MPKLELNMRDVERYVESLGMLASRGLPYAARNSVNEQAFQARGIWQGEARDSMTLRRTWTERSMRVTKAGRVSPGMNLALISSETGSNQEYMKKQEFGGTESKTGEYGVPIPTSVASSEGRNAQPKLKMPTRANRMKTISLLPRAANSASRRVRNAAQIQQALDKGHKYVFLDLVRKKGIFRFNGRGKSWKIDMVWDLSEPTITTKPNPTLERTTDKVGRKIPEITIRAIVDQLKRNRIIRGSGGIGGLR